MFALESTFATLPHNFMLVSPRRPYGLIVALLGFLFTAPALAQRIIVNIIPVVNGAPLRLDTVAYTNAAGERYSVTRNHDVNAILEPTRMLSIHPALSTSEKNIRKFLAVKKKSTV